MDDVDFYLYDLKTKFSKIDSKEYYLSYSGGKDSHLLYWFIKKYLKDEDIKIVGVNTYMEHHEILQRILNNCDVVLIPAMKPFEVKQRYGIPCFSKIQDRFVDMYQCGNRAKSIMRYINADEVSRFNLNKTARELLLSNKLHKISNKCCKYLKKEPLKQFEKETGLKPILGVRGEESNLRKSRYTSCFTKDMKFTPIWDLTNELENKIHKKYNIEIPNVYNYLSRTRLYGVPIRKL